MSAQIKVDDPFAARPDISLPVIAEVRSDHQRPKTQSFPDSHLAFDWRENKALDSSK